MPGGYGWVFPKGDHANLGVGGWGERGAAASRPPRPLAHAHGVDAGRGDRGAGTSPADAAARHAGGRGCVLLVGDAAGLVDPLSGDGMYEAFVSARLAADAILAGDLDRYGRRWRRPSTVMPQRPGPRSERSTAIRRAVFAAARAPGVFGVVAGLLCGEVAHPADARGIARGPLKLVARLAG